jgi:hypothetical protein
MSGADVMTPQLSGCAVVMAHPDDEVLWASSVLDAADRVILCYSSFPGKPAISDGRRRAIGTLPLKNVECLELVEASMFDHATWPLPEEIPEGLAPRRMPFNLEGAVLGAYKANYEVLCRTLEDRLRDVSDVVTHNPWGEYGHEDHVQVFRAVEAVQQKLGFRVWVTGYVSDKAVILMQQHLYRLGSPTPRLATNRDLGDHCRQIYIENACWTWSDDYVWPETEWFYSLLPRADALIARRFAVQHAGMDIIQTNWTKPGSVTHFLDCGLRHLRYRAVQHFPSLWRWLQAWHFGVSLRTSRSSGTGSR